nr:mutant coat protein [Strawberry vein banding virus]
MSSRRERLEQLFEEDHLEIDAIIQYLSLLDDELDNCQEEKLQVLVAKEMISYSSSSEDEAANVKANIKEEDEDTYRPNRKRRGTSSSQPNYTRELARKRKLCKKLETGMEVLEEYSKQDNITKGSLGYAHNLIKAYMEKKCKSLKIKKEIRRNMCCPKFSSPETQYGCKPFSHKKAKKKKYKQYYKKKYRLRKPKRWTNSRRKYSGRKLFRRKRDQKEESSSTTEDKKKFCPQGKTTCRCWICNEIGHFAKDCRNKSAGHNRIIEELQSLQLEPVFNLDELKEEEKFWELEEVSESSESESESSSDGSTDSEDLE